MVLILLAAALVVVLRVPLVYLLALNTFFKTQPLGQMEMAVVVAASVLVFLAIELEKWVKRRRGK